MGYIRAENDDFIVFKIIEKPYTYDFIQTYSYRILDIKKRKVYSSELKQEGTFDNIREDAGLIVGECLYRWDQKNTLVVYKFSIEKSDFVEFDRISVPNMSTFKAL